MIKAFSFLILPKYRYELHLGTNYLTMGHNMHNMDRIIRLCHIPIIKDDPKMMEIERLFKTKPKILKSNLKTITEIFGRALDPFIKDYLLSGS